MTAPCKQCHPELHRSQCWEGGCVADRSDDGVTPSQRAKAQAEKSQRAMREGIATAIVDTWQVAMTEEATVLQTARRFADAAMRVVMEFPPVHSLPARDCQCPHPNNDCEHPTCPRVYEPDSFVRMAEEKAAEGRALQRSAQALRDAANAIDLNRSEYAEQFHHWLHYRADEMDPGRGVE